MDELLQELPWEGLAYAITAVSALLVIAGLYALTPDLRRRWLPLPRLRPGTWVGNEVFLAFCVFFGFRDLIILLLLQIGFFNPILGPPPGENASTTELMRYMIHCYVIGSPLTFTVALGMIFAMMYARAGARPHHYGLSWSRFPANLALGLIAFIVARPIIMALYAGAVLAFPRETDPIEELAKSGLPAWEWLLFAFQITVAAPVLEEILCRGILQGWLRRASLNGHVFMLVFALFVGSYLNLERVRQFDFASLGFIVLLAAAYVGTLVWLKRRFNLSDDEIQSWQVASSWPTLDPTSFGDEDAVRIVREETRRHDDERARQWADANANLAIFGSALFFAAIHANWPGPIALFPMGLLLGWLARRTQSLTAPIAFHAAFNLASFIMLYTKVLRA